MKHLAIAAALSLSACSDFELSGETPIATPGGVGDMLTTTAVLLDGGVELNPALAPFGDAAGLAAMGTKYVGTEAMIQSGMNPDFAVGLMDSAGYVGICNNGLQLLTSLDVSVTVIIGALCALGVAEWQHDLRNTPAMLEDVQ